MPLTNACLYLAYISEVAKHANLTGTHVVTIHCWCCTPIASNTCIYVVYQNSGTLFAPPPPYFNRVFLIYAAPNLSVTSLIWAVAKIVHIRSKLRLAGYLPQTQILIRRTKKRSYLDENGRSLRVLCLLRTLSAHTALKGNLEYLVWDTAELFNGDCYCCTAIDHPVLYWLPVPVE